MSYESGHKLDAVPAMRQGEQNMCFRAAGQEKTEKENRRASYGVGERDTADAKSSEDQRQIIERC